MSSALQCCFLFPWNVKAEACAHAHFAILLESLSKYFYSSYLVILSNYINNATPIYFLIYLTNSITPCPHLSGFSFIFVIHLRISIILKIVHLPVFYRSITSFYQSCKWPEDTYVVKVKTRRSSDCLQVSIIE